MSKKRSEGSGRVRQRRRKKAVKSLLWTWTSLWVMWLSLPGSSLKAAHNVPQMCLSQEREAEHLCSNSQSHWWTVVLRGLQFLHTPGQGLSKPTGCPTKSEAEKGRNYVGIWDEILAACPVTIIVTKIWGGWRVCEAGHTKKCMLASKI